MSNQETIHFRISRLARILCMTPCKNGPELVRHKGQWWLTRCVEGDQPLPQTRDAKTIKEALDFSEAWFSPEVFTKNK